MTQTKYGSGNGVLAQQVLEELIAEGITEFCLCPSSRNAPLVYPLVNSSQVQIYYWPEERSAAFFALGRIKETKRPVAVVTTSGTAVGELLPAAMEGYYSGLPLVLITADRPRRFRGTGAPQSAEQIGIFSHYVEEFQDIGEGEICSIAHWTRAKPIHLNLCFEEPKDRDCELIRIDECFIKEKKVASINFSPDGRYLSFLQKSCFPLVVVGEMDHSDREEAIDFLLHLSAPIYAEGISSLREECRLDHLKIKRIEQIWQLSDAHGYPIDGILRIGGIPTARLWRDLEFKEGEIPVCSISPNPFSGLSWGEVIHTSLSPFFSWAKTIPKKHVYRDEEWKKADRLAYHHIITLFEEEPLAEASLIHVLSKAIPSESKIYLGNSMPIREWDQAATYEIPHFHMGCNRGVNGIDGQLATFLGFCSKEQENWAILGDLTMLYDLVAPWIASQMPDLLANVVVVNNGGAGIFTHLFNHSAFLNRHELSFEYLAKFWGWEYERWKSIPTSIEKCRGKRLIELIPDSKATERFWRSLAQ